jgi:hypothetical protein
MFSCHVARLPVVNVANFRLTYHAAGQAGDAFTRRTEKQQIQTAFCRRREKTSGRMQGK